MGRGRGNRIRGGGNSKGMQGLMEGVDVWLGSMGRISCRDCRLTIEGVRFSLVICIHVRMIRINIEVRKKALAARKSNHSITRLLE